MGKGILHLSVQGDLVEEAKSRGINLSAMMESILSTELGLQQLDISNDEDLIKQLKYRLSKLTEELINKNKEIKTKEKRIIELEEKLENQDYKNNKNIRPYYG